MGMSEAERREAAEGLFRAEKTRQWLEPITLTYESADIADAYAIGQMVTEAKVAGGRVVKGHKVGLTSKAMRSLTGATEPDYGTIFDDWFVDAWRELFILLLDGVPSGDARFRDAVRATRMVGRNRFDFGFHHELLTWMVEPYLAPRFRFDRAYTRRGHRFSAPNAANSRAMSIPAEWIWLARAHMGLHAVLARLGSEGEFRNALRAALSAVPSPLPADETSR